MIMPEDRLHPHASESYFSVLFLSLPSSKWIVNVFLLTTSPGFSGALFVFILRPIWNLIYNTAFIQCGEFSLNPLGS